MKQGKFLVIEGAHGTGKTTLALALKKNLERKGCSVSLSKEPFSKDMIKTIRKYSKGLEPHVLNHLVLADRFLHVKFLEKALNANDLVISVRYTPSSFVYQRISGIPLSIIETLNKHFMKFDKLVMLHSTYQKRIKRIKQRPKSFFMDKKNLTLEQRYYSAICKKMKNNRNALVIDSTQSKSKVLENVLRFLNLH